MSRIVPVLAVGQNSIVDTRWAEGRSERFPELVADLVRLSPAVIVVAIRPLAP